ncbi:MAG: hypothetical protein HY471_03075 [Candidatus Sungbacteria bacterium]|nr:hypothetical protein [Candidatus Sungbacteria bacterium]
MSKRQLPVRTVQLRILPQKPATVHVSLSAVQQSVIPEVSRQTLAVFDMTPTANPVVMQQIRFGFKTEENTSFTNIEIVDEATGVTVAGPKDATTRGGGGYVVLTDPFEVSLDSRKYSLRGKLTGTTISNQIITVFANPAIDWKAVDQVTGKSIIPNAINPRSSLMGSAKVVKTSLDVSRAAAPASQNTVRGVNMFPFANFIFEAKGSGEDLRITSLQLNLKTDGSAVIDTCQLYDGATALNTGSNVLNPRGADMHTFMLDTHLIIPKETSRTIALKCNVSAGGSGSFAEWYLTGDEDIFTTGVTTGNRVSVEVIPSTAPQPVIFVEKGTLSVSLDASSPSARLVTAGTSNAVVTIFKLHASDEPISLSSISLQFHGANIAALVKVTLWDGAAKVGEAVFAGTNTIATSTLTSAFVIPKDGDKLLIVKAEFSNVGTSEPARAGDTVAIGYNGGAATFGFGALSGARITSSTSEDIQGSSVTIFRTMPTIQVVNIPSHTLQNGTMTLYRFSVTASAAGDVGLGKVTFLVSSSTSATTSNFRLYGYSDSAFSVQAYATNPFSLPRNQQSNGEVEMYMSPVSGSQKEAIQIPAGTVRYFELQADVRGAASGDAVAVFLRGDQVFSGVGSLAGIDAAANSVNNFIWSGNSTTTSLVTAPDWANGALLPGLPAGGTATQVITR